MPQKWFAFHCRSPTDSVDTLQSTLASKTSTAEAVKDLFTFVYFFCNENITNFEKFVYHSIQGHLNISHAKFHLPPINQSKIPKISVKSLEVSTFSRV